MLARLRRFEQIAANALQFGEPHSDERLLPHPFDVRNIHPRLPSDVKALFDNGHFAQATFEAYKYVDTQVQRLSNIQESGSKLMMKAFNLEKPALQLTKLVTVSDRDEQAGFQFVFAGSAMAIRNPRGHGVSIRDDPDLCLDHLSLASLLLRKLEEAGYSLT